MNKDNAGPQVLEQAERKISASNIWISIVIGLFSSAVFYIFFQPAIDWIVSFSSVHGRYLFNYFLDRGFEQAARGTVWIYAATLSVINGAISGAAAGSLFASIVFLRQRGTQSKIDRVFFTNGRRSVVRYTLIGFSILAIFTSFSQSALIYISLQSNVGFQQRLAIITPLIGDDDRNLIVATWAGMKSYVDYGLIMKRIEGIANAKGVSLPDRLI